MGIACQARLGRTDTPMAGSTMERYATTTTTTTTTTTSTTTSFLLLLLLLSEMSDVQESTWLGEDVGSKASASWSEARQNCGSVNRVISGGTSVVEMKSNSSHDLPSLSTFLAQSSSAKMATDTLSCKF